MRDVQFQEVGMENFGPYIDPMILLFPNNTLTLLTGPNGIGKTMSLDAIPFSLYGITSKKAKGDDVVNNVVGKNCKTWVKFKINEDQYTVTRYHKYTKLGNTVILNQNGVDTKNGHREVLPELERLLCSQKAFMNTLMFGQKVKDFFTDLVDSDKKEIFRKILGLELYVMYYKQAGNKLKELEDAIDELQKRLGIDGGLLEDAVLQIQLLSNARIKFFEEQKKSIDLLKESLNDNERLLRTLEIDSDHLKIQVDPNIENTIQKLTQVRGSIAVLEKDTSVKLQELQHHKERKKLELEAIANENKTDIKDHANTLTLELQNKETELTTALNDFVISTQSDRHELELQIEKRTSANIGLEERISEINHNVLEKDLSTCPTCEQDVTDEVVDKLIMKVKKYQSEIEKNKTIFSELIEKDHVMRKHLTSTSDMFHTKIADVKSEIRMVTLNQEMESRALDARLQKAITKVNEAATFQKDKVNQEHSKNKQDLEEEEQRLANEKQAQEKELEKIAEMGTKIATLSQKIDSINSQIEYKENELYDETQFNSYIKKERQLKIAIKENKRLVTELSKKIMIHKFWKTGYSSSGIPSMLIDDSIPFMNEKITDYLELLTNGRYIVSFDTLDETKAGDFRDKISVRVVDTHTKANSRVQLSGGQTRIIDIATILTLGDLQSNIQDVKFNILLFDEIFDALDYENANYVSKVLNKLKVDKSIYVISHQHQDQLEPDETLTMR
jgi:DNA repair exonuclease SbcCD ATPase subunit